MTPSLALATFVIVATLLYGVFARSERRLAADTRRRIARYLGAERPSAREQQDFAGAFLDWFDRAFKVRKRQVPVLGEVVLPSFWRSVLVTFDPHPLRIVRPEEAPRLLMTAISFFSCSTVI